MSARQVDREATVLVLVRNGRSAQESALLASVLLDEIAARVYRSEMWWQRQGGGVGSAAAALGGS